MGLKKIVVVQFKLNEAYYLSEEVFRNKIARVLALADSKIKLDEDTIVVFPENIGSFLVFLGEESTVKTVNSLRVALRKMVRDNYPSLLKIWVRARKWFASLYLKKSKEMLDTYISVFSRLAKIYKTNIVAGTILIPEVHKLGSKIALSGHKVYNTCFVFDTKGRVAGIQQKRVLGALDKFLEAFSSNKINLIKLNVGLLGVAIGEDCFNYNYLRELKQMGANILVNPAIYWGKWSPEVEKEWSKGCRAHVQKLKIKYGLCSMAVGRILDILLEGRSSIIVPLEKTINGSGYLAKAKSYKDEEILSIKIS